MMQSGLIAKNLQKGKERLSEDKNQFHRDDSKDHTLGDFQLQLITTDDTELPNSGYVPVLETGYTAIVLDMVIKASYRRYKIDRLDANNFLVQPSNTKKIIAILNAIEIGKKYSCLADYFNDNPRPQKASSPFLDLRVFDDNNASLWNELYSNFQTLDVNIQILFPYTVTSSKWMVGEININKIGKVYQLSFAIHDPYGCYTMFNFECDQLTSIFIENIKKVDKDAEFKKTNCNMSPSPRTINFNDQCSSSIIAVEILFARATNHNFDALQEFGASKLRQIQFDCLISILDKNDPRRARFINKYGMKINAEMKKISATKKTLMIKYQNEYKPIFTPEDIHYLENCHTPKIMSLNEHAAFYAAKTGNVLLMAALLGINFTEQDEIEQDKAANQIFALKDEFCLKIFEIKVIKAQINAIDKFIKQPEHLRKLSELKEELETISAHRTDKIILSFEGWLNDISNADIRSEKLAFKDFSLARQEQILKNFREKLYSKKYKLQINLYSEGFDLKAEKVRLTEQLTPLESAIKIIDEDGRKEFMTWCNYQIRKQKAKEEHIQIITRITRDKIHTLPNFYPQDTQALYEFLYSAKVPVNLRNQENNTLLHIACASGHIGVIKVLLTREAKIDVLNNLGLTPEEMGDNHMQDILSLKNQAYDSFGEDSIFLKEIMKFESEYKTHLATQLRRQQMTIVGWFLNNIILTQRQLKAIRLQKYIELARKEGDDSILVSYLENELAEHNKAGGRDTGMFGTSMFFSGIEEILERVQDKQDDYKYVRLSTNIRKATLYYRLKQAEICEKETAQKLHDVTIALEQEKEKNTQQNKKFEEEIHKQNSSMESWKREQEKKQAEDMKALETRLMTMISSQQKEKNDLKPPLGKGIADAAGDHGIFATLQVISSTVSDSQTQNSFKQRPT